MKGKLIILSGPSGSGKTTLVHHLLKSVPGLEFSVSATSRKKRRNEKDGRDYYFMSADDFRDKISNNEFIEWEEVYDKQYYGTLRSEVEKIRIRGINVVFDVDVVGGLNIKKQFGDDALAIFVRPPSLDVLEARLSERSTEDPESFRQRMEKAVKELEFAASFDQVLVNDKLDEASFKVTEMVIRFIQQNRMKTGLFFGSFNPVHIGHMAIASYMLEFTDLDQLWFVLSPHNPHKVREALLAYHHRLEMLYLAIGNDLRFKVSDVESKMPKPSYTIDTLTYLSEKYPEMDFRLILGADNLKKFYLWKNAEEIIKNFHRYVYPRTDYEDTALLDSHKNISLVKAPKMEISSSFIRNAISQGRDMRYFLPPGVYEYIDRNNLYEK